jgi:pyruvate/2-oxoacid:ferredoxin oxidoreductase beta subunit
MPSLHKLNGSHSFFNSFPMYSSVSVSAPDGKIKPHMRHNKILLDASALFVAQTNFILRQRQTLVCGHAVPIKGFFMVLRYSSAIFMHVP